MDLIISAPTTARRRIRRWPTVIYLLFCGRWLQCECMCAVPILLKHASGEHFFNAGYKTNNSSHNTKTIKGFILLKLSLCVNDKLRKESPELLPCHA